MSGGHFNKLTPSQAERLALLIEECGEVIQAASKVLRHGYESVNPALTNSPTNRQSLEKELGQLMFAADLIVEHDLSPAAVAKAAKAKRESIRQWLHHNRGNVP